MPASKDPEKRKLWIERLRESAKKPWQDPEYRKMHSELTKGEKNPNAKLTEKDVIDIKKRLQQGERNIDIAKIYNVGSHVISMIKCNKSWKHVEV